MKKRQILTMLLISRSLLMKKTLSRMQLKRLMKLRNLMSVLKRILRRNSISTLIWTKYSPLDGTEQSLRDTGPLLAKEVACSSSRSPTRRRARGPYRGVTKKPRPTRRCRSPPRRPRRINIADARTQALRASAILMRRE